MKTLHSTIVLVLGSTLVTPVLAGVNDDLFQVITDNALLRHTSCGAFDFGSLTARAPIVRGKTAKVRIQKNFVDVGLETASVSSCGGKCSANITHKGGVTQKGFAEIDLVVNGDAPLGNATLVMHYFGGGTGSYDLLIVPDSRIDSVTAANVSNTGDHITFRGSALDRFPATLISVNHNFTRISESDTRPKAVELCCIYRAILIEPVVDKGDTPRLYCYRHEERKVVDVDPGIRIRMDLVTRRCQVHFGFAEI